LVSVCLFHVSSVQISVLVTDSSGFGAYNYYVEAKAQREISMLEEEKRLARNQQLMDAYGDKNSLHDVQQALDTYNVQ
jgi:hypothetical protein